MHPPHPTHPRTWVVEAVHQLSSLRRTDAPIQAQVLPPPPGQVLLHHIQGARHGAEQEHLVAPRRQAQQHLPGWVGWSLVFACFVWVR
jgi:hypothetical protein